MNDEIGERNGEYLTLPDAALAVGLSVRVLRRGARLGWFPIYAPGGSRVRVRLADVEAFIRSTLVQPATEAAVAHADGVVTERLQRETQKRRVLIHEQPASIDPRGQEKARSPSATPTPSSVAGSSLTET